MRESGFAHVETIFREKLSMQTGQSSFLGYEILSDKSVSMAILPGLGFCHLSMKKYYRK